MNRLASLAVVGSAMLGTAAGVAVATIPDPAPDPPKTATQPPASPGALLYLDGRTLHDGDRTITKDAPPDAVAVQRAAGGYLVVSASAGESTAYDVSLVNANGDQESVAQVDGDWDLNEDGTLLAARSLDRLRYRVIEIATGKLVDETRTGPLEDSKPVGGAAFLADDKVLTGWSQGDSEVIGTWDLGAGDVGLVANDTSRVGAAPDGSAYAGVTPEPVNAEGGPSDRSCLSGGSSDARLDERWMTCPWVPVGTLAAQFGPDSTQLLGIRARDAAGRPSQIAVLDAIGGQVTSGFRAPAGSTTVQWADDEHLFVHTTASTIQRCTLDGDCEEVARTTGPVVLGSVG